MLTLLEGREGEARKGKERAEEIGDVYKTPSYGSCGAKATTKDLRERKARRWIGIAAEQEVVEMKEAA